MKPYIKLLIVGLFVMSNKLYADIFSLDDLRTDEYARHYNTLLAPESTSKALREHEGFSSFLREAESIVTQYELESHLGLRLVHRHFTVNTSQVMAEESGAYAEQAALITSAHNIDDALTKRMVPASWIFSPSSGPQIFEASNDEAVHEGSRMLVSNPEFMEEMQALLTTYKLTDLLSLAVLKRAGLVADSTQVYAEVNHLGADDEESGRSIVRVWSADSEQLKDSIQTSWSFRGPRQLACVPMSICVPYDTGHAYRPNGHVRNG